MPVPREGPPIVPVPPAPNTRKPGATFYFPSTSFDRAVFLFCLSAETDKWKKISYVFIPACVVYAAFVTVRHNAHHHEEDHDAVRRMLLTLLDAPWLNSDPPARDPPPPPFHLSGLHPSPSTPYPRARAQPQYPFMKKRDKPMPWAASKMGMGSDCDLFDYTCSNKFKAMKAAEAAE